MKKQTMIIVFTVTHILCIILGYCIASIRVKAEKPTADISVSEEIAEAAMETTLSAKETFDASIDVMEGNNEEETIVPPETSVEVTQPSTTTPTTAAPPIIEEPNVTGNGENDTAYDDI